jgi:hypothetical protein
LKPESVREIACNKQHLNRCRFEVAVGHLYYLAWNDSLALGDTDSRMT